MENENITPDELEIFGLSNYESRAYLSLLNSGVRTAKEVSEDSKIPFGRIYDVLSSLEDKGLSDKQESRPMKFIAKEPKVALKNLLTMKNSELKFLKNKAKVVEVKLSRFPKVEPKESLFWSVAIGNKAIDRYIEKISEAESELHTILDIRVAARLPTNDIIINLIKVVNLLNSDGVSVKILLTGVDPGSFEEEYLKSIIKYFAQLDIPKVKHCYDCTTAFDVIDNEKVVVKVMNPVKPDEFFAWIFVWQEKFATELQVKFMELWANANKLEIGLQGIE
ncbi:MAG: TrmB family transcriptional regulator [Candidatus Hodarchaeales archaeon]|jgi:sugar-specific transcriptional regulator TrmB